MTATKITTLADGTAILETFDYRSEFAFDDFVCWIADTLGIHPVSGEIEEDMEPFDFEWRGSIFKARWDDDHGCFVEALAQQIDLLRQMQSELSI